MRLRELDGVSRVARETREQIAQNLQVAEVNLRSKFAPLRASMKKSRSLVRVFNFAHTGIGLLRTFIRSHPLSIVACQVSV